MGEDAAVMTIVVDDDVLEFVNRVTRTRFFAVVSFADDGKVDKALLNSDPSKALWLNVCEKQDGSYKPTELWLYVGGAVFSRSIWNTLDWLEFAKKELRAYREDGSCDVGLCRFADLKTKLEGRALAVSLACKGDMAAPVAWMHDVLGLPKKVTKGEREMEGRTALSDDSSSVRIVLEKTGADQKGLTRRCNSELAADQSRADELLDIRDFEIMDRLDGLVRGVFADMGYRNDLIVRYSIIYDGTVQVRYAIMFYSNHVWILDPVNVLDIGFDAVLAPGIYTYEMLQRNSPQKVTCSKRNKEAYFVAELVMANDVSIKWYRTVYAPWGDGVSRPNETCSKDRTLEVASQLANWLYDHIIQIEMA